LDDFDKQMKLIDDHSRLWMRVVGSRGAIGKKTINASTQFASLFEEV
jgi:alkylated DNA nucleotide flippase Atl1